MRVAVVDIGTNSTRLLVADLEPGGGLRELRREAVVTRLGEGVDTSGRLGEPGQARVLATLERYAAAIARHGCAAAAAVMTSAVRDAANGDAFAARVRAQLGVQPRVLSGEEEARFTFAGATAARPGGGPGELLVVDIGGGSTELVCGSGFHVSTQIGVVRHSERHLHADPPPPAERARLAAAVRAAVLDAVPADVRARTGSAVAVAGTATSCAAIDLALEPYDSARVEGHVLSRAALEAILERLAAVPVARRRAIPGLHPDRAPTIVAGVVILIEVLGAFALGAVEVSDHDLLWGVALDLA